jgi:dTMP kinase
VEICALSESDQRSEGNSVLIALRELRGMENDRVKREKEEARVRVEAERAAKEAAERRARDEVEARKLAEEDRLRRIEDDKQSRIREEALRVEEAERRARVEGEMKLQEQRMRLEIQSRAGRSPMKAVAIGVVAVALVAGVLIYRINAQHARQQAQQEEQAKAEKEQARAEAKAETEALRAQIAAITHDMDQKLKLAKTQAEVDKIKADARARQDAAAESARSGKSHKKAGGASTDSATPKPAVPHIPGKRDINDDILNGL